MTHEPIPGRAPDKDRPAALLLIPLTLLLFALVTVFFVVWRAALVAGPSMLPTLKPEDRLLTTRGYADLRHGDIVVFEPAELYDEGDDVVKRVIGLPGDVVLVAGDRVWVNGQAEPTDRPLRISYTAPTGVEVRVPPGELFLLGDNRPASFDSREMGPVPHERVKGRVVAVFAPIDRIRRIDRER